MKTISTAAFKKAVSVFNARTLAMTAMLAAISFILGFLEFPVPLSPSFARMDLSDFPALIGAFAFGPVAGVTIEFVKNALQLLSTSTGGIGDLVNFVMGTSYVFTAGLIYSFHKTKRTARIESVVMGIMSAVMNYFVLLPMFEQFMPLDQVIASFGVFIPFIKTKLDVVLYNAFPFNLLKGLVIIFFTMLIYKRLTPILKGAKLGRIFVMEAKDYLYFIVHDIHATVVATVDDAGLPVTCAIDIMDSELI